MNFVSSIFGRSRVLALLTFAALSPHAALAACSGPSGNAGDINYSSSQNLMVYCNGSNWISMGASAGTTSFGALTTGDFCTATGSNAITCGTTSSGSGSVVLSASPTLSGTITAAGATFSGIVAIGTTSANGALNVNGTITDTGETINGTATATLFSGSGASLTSIGTASLGGITGTPSSTTYLRGDGTWATAGAALSGGTANYVPLWIGTASIGTSSIYQGGIGLVSIGTTTSNGALNVNGTVTATLFSGSGASLTGIGTANLGGISGTPSTATFLRGDGTWATGGAGQSATTWAMIGSTDISSATTSYTFSGLSGDTDIEYMVVGRFVSGGSSSTVSSFFVLPNADSSTSDYGYQNIYGSGTTPSANNVTTASGLYLGHASGGQLTWGSGVLYAKSGQTRTWNVSYQQGTSGTSTNAMNLMGGTWNNTASPITSLEIIGSNSGSIGVGTHIELWALRGVGGLGAVSGTGQANYVPYWSSGSVLSNSPIAVSGSSVGVGTTSVASGQVMEVDGNAQIDGTATATLFSGSGASLTGIGTANLGSISGSPSATTYLRGDGTWASISGGTLASLTDVSLSGLANNNILQYNSSTSKWVNTALTSAVSAAIAPSFSVNKNGTAQTVTANTLTKVTFGTVGFDTISGWSTSNNRYTPTVAGKYTLSGTAYCTGNTGYCVVAIYKNGTMYARSAFETGYESNPTVDAVIDMNGTSDYVELWVQNQTGTTINGGTTNTYFSGGLLAPLASGSVAGTGTASYLPMWTSGTTIGTSSVYQDGSGNIAIGTTGTNGALNVSGTATATLFSGSGASLTGMGISNLSAITGTPSSSTYLRGDGTWAAPNGGALANLTDVSLSGLANNNILQYNATSSTWVNTPVTSAVTAAVAPSFRVNKGGTAQTVTANSTTKLTWSTVAFDTINGWSSANNRYTPTIAGKYVFNLTVDCTTIGFCVGYIYKNGSLYAADQQYNGSTSNADIQPSTTAIVDMNGTTDYVEAYVLNTGSTTIPGGTNAAYFQGALLAPLASGSVAGTGTASYVPYWTSSTTLSSSPIAISSSNVSIGTTAAGSLLNVNGGVSIGTSYVGTAAPTNGAIIQGSVGIGTTGQMDSGATSVLNVNGNAATTNVILRSNSIERWDGNAENELALNYAGYLSGLTQYRDLNVYNGEGASVMFVQGSTGRVGIGTTSPSYTLDVNGSLRANGASVYFSGISNGAGNSYVCMNGGLITWSLTACGSSDARLKKNVQTISDALSKVGRLRGVTFDWKDESRGNGQQIGLIAQEVETVFPQVVRTDPQGIRSVRYEALVAPLIEAVKELKADNDNLRAANDNEAAQIKALTARLDALEAKRR